MKKDIHFHRFLDHAEKGQIHEVESMIAGGTPLDVVDAHGRTALHLAARNHHVKIMDFLLDQGLSIEVAESHGNTVLHQSAFMNNDRSCAYLLDRGASLKAVNFDGHTPLLRCAFSTFETSIQPLKVLLDAGADILERDHKKGSSVLHLVNDDQKFQFLLDRGADIHARDASGNTPLHVAAMQGKFEVCVSLLRAGANADLKNNNGFSPLDLCFASLHKESSKSKSLTAFFLRPQTDEFPRVDAREASALALIAYGAKADVFSPTDALAGTTRIQAAVRLGFTPLVCELMNDASLTSEDSPESMIPLAIEHKRTQAAAAIQSILASREIDRITSHHRGITP